jgi:aminoglycoside 6'-N-acetyltransferase I
VTIDLRTATTRDIAGIQRVQKLAGLKTSGPEVIRAAVADDNRIILVALLDGRIAGWAKTHHWDYADGLASAGHYLGGISVEPGARRRGIGVALTAARLDWIFDRTDEAWYVANSTNVASIALHTRWGFEEIARGRRFHTSRFDASGGVLFRAYSSKVLTMAKAARSR